MSRRIDLGRFVDGKAFRGDLDIILRSNALVQANSGGGKSWLLRRMIEQSFGRVPQIVIDPEGEFSTLRQKFDLVLVGKGGDTPADLRSAQLLAHRLLELGTSAVVDLFEMSKTQRPLWVAAFVQALVDAPKKLWRDLLLYVDEAHELAPEAGHGAHESSSEKACRHALIDFAAKGRKRGYGVIAATQRLGKLSKDFAAELKNVLIGQTFIDIDRERAAGSLGIAKADKPEFFRNVKTLHPGSFFSLGRAFTLEPTLVTIGGVQTEHPEAGRRQSAPPPPTEKIRHLLPQLADLPKEAETKIQTEKELKARIAELERQLRSTERHLTNKEAALSDRPRIEKSVLKPGDLAKIERLAAKLGTAETAFSHVTATAVDRLAQSQQVVISEVGNLAKVVVELLRQIPTPTVTSSGAVTTVTKGAAVYARPLSPATRASLERGIADAKAGRVVPAPEGLLDAPLPEKSIRMIGALQQGEAMGLMQMPFKNVALIAGVAPTSGTTSNRKGTLVKAGLITVLPNHFVRLTDAGRAYKVDIPMPPTDPAELLAYWKREIGTAKIAAMLEAIVNQGPITNAALAEAVGMEGSSGTFSNYKGALVGRGLIVKVDRDTYDAAEVFRR